MSGGDTGVEVADVDGRVETLVGKGVGHRSPYSRTVFTVVSVRPFGTRIGNVFFGDQAAVATGNFASGDIEIPVDSPAVFARPGVTF